MNLVDKLYRDRILTEHEFVQLLQNQEKYKQEIRELAVQLSSLVYGNSVFVRGLIECTNYCRNNCNYCGIRKESKLVSRYRLSTSQIIECCKNSYQLGFRTFVLQGGEDTVFVSKLTPLISKIKSLFPDCALTLSLGEQTQELYKDWKLAGADRYLLRHETANPLHYALLHSFESFAPTLDSNRQRTAIYRQKCLFTLKELGYQTGSGFMVGSPGQTLQNIAQDLLFLHSLSPQMIGIGPFIPSKNTPYSSSKAGSTELTLFLLSVLRVMFPNALIPATTALNTLDQNGRIKGILAGANVIMPNISPLYTRKKYTLYDNKNVSGQESIEGLNKLRKSIENIGYYISFSRGDYVQEPSCTTPLR